MLTKKQTILILVVLFTLMIAGAVAIALVGRKNQNSEMTSVPETESMDEPTRTVQFYTPITEMTIGSPTTLDIVVDPVSPPLTAVTVEMIYDPAVLEITQLRTGTLWNQQSELERVIDGQNGVARITVGQGFDAQPTGEALIASVDVVGKQPGQTIVSFGPQTLLARAGVSGSLPVTLRSIVLTIQ